MICDHFLIISPLADPFLLHVKMVTIPSASWEEYTTWSHERVPELETSPTPELVKALDNIAYAGEEAFLDFEVLFHRLRHATDPRGFGPLPLLNDLYSAYVALFSAVFYVSNKCGNYLARCQRVLDPTREDVSAIDDSNSGPATLEDFDEQYKQFRLDITAATGHWGKAVWSLCKDMKERMPASWMIHAESFVLPWLLDSKRHSLIVDLPNMVIKAEWHLNSLLHVFESLNGLLKEIEMVMVADTQSADVCRPALCKTIEVALRLVAPITLLFMRAPAPPPPRPGSGAWAACTILVILTLVYLALALLLVTSWSRPPCASSTVSRVGFDHSTHGFLGAGGLLGCYSQGRKGGPCAARARRVHADRRREKKESIQMDQEREHGRICQGRKGVPCAARAAGTRRPAPREEGEHSNGSGA
ncbi:hypothetical protein DFH06DRAFT_1463899 [Mycena polygramma]|nr:hypothetical protein DFH06DRAFT_1463899 [Mycena polygramma]